MSVFGPKWAIFDSFDPKMAKTFFGGEYPKKSLPYAYYDSTLCKKLEQSYERILRSKMHARTYGRMNGGEFKGPNRLRRGTKMLFFIFNHYFVIFVYITRCKV